MNPEVFLTLFQLAVLAAVLLAALRLLSAARGALRIVFFCFAVACLLFSDLYWLAYGLLRPETRMPFAANEICEWSSFLLLGAALKAAPPARSVSARWEMLGAALFTAACTALWIAWSGEWLQDLLTGLCFGWFLVRLAARMKGNGTLSRRAWRLAGLICTVLAAAQAATFFVPETVSAALDLCCYGLLFAGNAFLLTKAVLALRRGEDVCPAFLAFAWTITTLYMSSGTYYLAAVLLSTLCFPLMLLALRKEAAA